MNGEQKSATDAKEPPSAVLSGARKTTEPRMVRGTKSEKTRHFMLLRLVEKQAEKFEVVCNLL